MKFDWGVICIDKLFQDEDYMCAHRLVVVTQGVMKT